MAHWGTTLPYHPSLYELCVRSLDPSRFGLRFRNADRPQRLHGVVFPKCVTYEKKVVVLFPSDKWWNRVMIRYILYYIYIQYILYIYTLLCRYVLFLGLPGRWIFCAIPYSDAPKKIEPAVGRTGRLAALYVSWWRSLQCEAPKIDKLVYNSNNHGFWYLTIVTGAYKPTYNWGALGGLTLWSELVQLGKPLLVQSKLVELLGGLSPTLWKMMEWKSVGSMTFPTEWKNKKCSKPPTRKKLIDKILKSTRRGYSLSFWLRGRKS